ncbi:SMP-30/gluconolactonase/LRE family protein [Actinokineospora bangkokensis]|uniref:SMP-30/Gluconolactonase/LRE-like region domain-containing protein n=1 Tax=Actinokineospora bangkokensis TaxID=1193682 RepID=A0A1Q9LLB9_9PSEU|nr:SMP-30/gluconolactonase/LRE family protein [Actinokineospora bangkokensis]OLR92828.1 hypothetical protein BJP25_19575 [Actinokineospora bangkokensis]
MSRFGPAEPTSTRWDVRRLNRPNLLWGSNGVSFGPDGRLYVAEYLGARICAVDTATGDVEVVEPVEGPVRSPDDLAFGADGSMYITDLVPGVVWRRSPAGEYTVVSDEVAVPNGITCVGDRLFVNEMRPGGRVLELTGGTSTVLADDLAMGNAMQLGPDGWLYYPHMLTGTVHRVPPDGGAAELVVADVLEPVAVRFDRGGVLHVLSRGGAGVVTRVDLFGTGGRALVTSGIAGLDNGAFDAENRLFVSSFASGGITELHPDGRTRTVVEPGFDGPYGVVVDLGGRVRVADHYRVAAPDGADGVSTEALLVFSHGIAVSPSGTLHLTSQFGDVRDHDPATGRTEVRAAGLDRPTGVAVRADGALVVAETGAGRVLVVDAGVSVLVEGLTAPVDVAVDGDRCWVSDESAGAVYEVVDGVAVLLADGLGAPQGIAVLGGDLLVVDTSGKRLLAVDTATGEVRVDAEDLPVGLPAGVVRGDTGLRCHGMPGMAPQFAGLATGPDGAVLLSANGEGTVLRLTPR